MFNNVSFCRLYSIPTHLVAESNTSSGEAQYESAAWSRTKGGVTNGRV